MVTRGVWVLLAVLVGAGCGGGAGQMASRPAGGSPSPIATGRASPSALPFAVGTPVNLGRAVNGPGFDGGPSLSADGRELYLISDRPGSRQGGGDIWVARRPSASAPFAPPQHLGAAVNSQANEGSPSISGDGLLLYFECFAPGTVFTCLGPGLGASGNSDIWVATRRAADRPFRAATHLGRPVNSPYTDGFPAISADGRRLYFASDRPGGSGDFDIWLATDKSAGGGFHKAVNLGPPVNGPSYDGDPAISADGLMLFFSSDRPGGSGGQDLWVALRTSTGGPFGEPINLGPRVNTTGFEGRPALSSDGSTLFFMSDRAGGFGGVDLWQVAIDRKA